MAVPITMSLFIDGAWVAFDGHEEAGWSVQVGPSSITGVRASRMEWQFKNPTYALDPYNPASPYYGKIGRNTRARHSLNGWVTSWGQASEWTPGADPEFTGPGSVRGRAWVDFAAEGLLRQLLDWDDDIESAMFRQIRQYSGLLGHWDLEDPAGAASFTNNAVQTRNGLYSGSVTLQGDDGAGGSDSCVVINSGGVMSFTFRGSSASGYQICWAAKLAALPSSATYQLIMQWSDTQGRLWNWWVNNVNFLWEVYDSGGTLLSGVTSGFGGGIAVNTWIRYRTKVTVSGGTVTYEPAWYAQDLSASFGVTNTFAGTVTGQPRTATVTGNAWTAGAAYCHFFALTDTTKDLLLGAAADAFNGYLNELATRRFLRLMDEEGFTRYLVGATAKSLPMGRQKPGRLVDLLTDCAVTDGGLIYDEPFDIALTMVTRIGMTNATPAIALSKATNVVDITRTISTSDIVNSVTVSNADGSSAVSELTSGALSVQQPPAGVTRKRGRVEVNLAGVGALGDRADWELARGTIDSPQYKKITIDLLQAPSLMLDLANLRPGQWVTVAGADPNTTDTITLIVLNKKFTGNAVPIRCDLECIPADLYTVAVSDSTTQATDSLTSTTAAITSTATSWVITFQDPKDAWSRTAAYDIKITGERIGVPVGGMSAVTGTGPYTQTLTGAVRSKNGVVKAHSAGESVRVAFPVRTTLGGL